MKNSHIMPQPSSRTTPVSARAKRYLLGALPLTLLCIGIGIFLWYQWNPPPEKLLDTLQTELTLPQKRWTIDPTLKKIPLGECLDRVKKAPKQQPDCFLRYLPNPGRKGPLLQQAVTYLENIAKVVQERTLSQKSVSAIESILDRTTPILEKFPPRGLKILKKLHGIIVGATT